MSKFTERASQVSHFDQALIENKIHKALNNHNIHKLAFIRDKFIENKQQTKLKSQAHSGEFMEVEKDFHFRNYENEWHTHNKDSFQKNYDLDRKNRQKQTPLLVCLSKASNRSEDSMSQASFMIMDIIEKGAIGEMKVDLSHEDVRGYNALQYAIESGHSDLVERMISIIPDSEIDNYLSKPWPSESDETKTPTVEKIQEKLPARDVHSIAKLLNKKQGSLYSDAFVNKVYRAEYNMRKSFKTIYSEHSENKNEILQKNSADITPDHNSWDSNKGRTLSPESLKSSLNLG